MEVAILVVWMITGRASGEILYATQYTSVAVCESEKSRVLASRPPNPHGALPIVKATCVVETKRAYPSPARALKM